MTEQLRFQQVVRNGRTIHFDHRPVLPPAELVDCVRHQFFSSARFAGDQNGGIGVRDPADHLVDFLHGRTVSDDCRNGGAWRQRS